MRRFNLIGFLILSFLLTTLMMPARSQAGRGGISFKATFCPDVSAEKPDEENPASATQQPQYIGIPRDKFEFYAAAQENSQWCWAATIQMVLNYYGVAIDQKQIVARTYGTDPYGRLPNWSGSFQAITGNLNNWSIDNSGAPYIVQASVFAGAPTPAYLLQELAAQHPVMIGYASGPTSAHAVVITAASYTPSQYGPIIQSLIVRDPWPSASNIQNRGRVEYPGAVLAQYIQAHWYIRVQNARSR